MIGESQFMSLLVPFEPLLQSLFVMVSGSQLFSPFEFKLQLSVAMFDKSQFEWPYLPFEFLH